MRSRNENASPLSKGRRSGMSALVKARLKNSAADVQTSTLPRRACHAVGT